MDRLNTDKRNQLFGLGAGGLVEDAFSIVLVGFVVLGLGGAAYQALKPSGWLTMVLDRVWDKSPWLVWLVGLALAATLMLGKRWLDRSAGRGSDALVYAFMALGLFFFFKLLVTGSL